MKRCSDYPDVSCCDSCHDDEALGYEMCHLRIEDGDETDAYVCCAVLRHMDRSPDITEGG